MHLSEVIRLVNTDRRVTVAWHRMGGPEILRGILDTVADAPVRVPEMIESRDVATGPDSFLDALSEAGSLRMRTDVEQHRAFVLALPGLDLAGLESIDVAG
jgi:hypothetical protein